MKTIVDLIEELVVLRQQLKWSEIVFEKEEQDVVFVVNSTTLIQMNQEIDSLKKLIEKRFRIWFWFYALILFFTGKRKQFSKTKYYYELFYVFESLDFLKPNAVNAKGIPIQVLMKVNQDMLKNGADAIKVKDNLNKKHYIFRTYDTELKKFRYVALKN